MKDNVISLRVDKNLRDKMKMHQEINWSFVLRKAIIDNLEDREKIDLEKSLKASKEMDKIVKLRVFDKGKNSTQIIREWRDKRK